MIVADLEKLLKKALTFELSNGIINKSQGQNKSKYRGVEQFGSSSGS